MTTVAHADPLHVLREYRNLAPWNLRDLSVVVGAVLDASAITPINAAARAAPSERTIRFYVTRGLVSPPVLVFVRRHTRASPRSEGAPRPRSARTVGGFPPN